jgi:hypothetical protein
MFKKSKDHQQLSIFSTQTFLSNKSLKEYENSNNWHNLFRVQVTERIDEELFRPLFCTDNGAPNASIRVLVAMMILKEARGCSDSQLFEDSKFNILVRSALGLVNIDDHAPVASTYYLLRSRIVEREKAGHSNLMEDVFSSITKSQIMEFNINGNKIRMDSKLLGSNIAWFNRYEVVHETLRMVYLSLNGVLDKILPVSVLSLLQEIVSEPCSNVSYRSNSQQLETKLVKLGVVIYSMLKHLADHSSEPINILREVFHQQYEVVSDDIILLPQERLSSSRIESPHDPECRYRKKGDQKQKGYSINITETCNPDNPINLATSVIVAPANIVDNEFLIPAIEQTEQIVSHDIETINTDGAYHSEVNQGYCYQKGFDLILSGLCGYPSRYDLTIDEHNKLIIIDQETKTILPSIQVKTRKADAPLKWKITRDNGKFRYFTAKDVANSLLRKQIAERNKAEKNLRNNVEATIFQLGYHYRANKSRYRSLIKHRIWANARCLWLNFVRIMKYITLLDPNSVNISQNCVQNVNYYFFFINNKIKNSSFLLERMFLNILPFFYIRIEVIDAK